MTYLWITLGAGTGFWYSDDDSVSVCMWFGALFLGFIHSADLKMTGCACIGTTTTLLPKAYRTLRVRSISQSLRSAPRSHTTVDIRPVRFDIASHASIAATVKQSYMGKGSIPFRISRHVGHLREKSETMHARYLTCIIGELEESSSANVSRQPLDGCHSPQKRAHSSFAPITLSLALCRLPLSWFLNQT